MIIRKGLFIAAFLSVFHLLCLLLIFPAECRGGALNGIYICGQTVIPSLFTFTACVLFITRIGILGRKHKGFTVFALSLIGGYPIGAKLLSELVKKGELADEKAQTMLLYCVNAGPAFIIISIGIERYSSKELGFLLFVSSVLSSVLMSLILNFRKNNIKNKRRESKQEAVSLSLAFTSSVSDAAESVISVCAYVILFSTVNSCIDAVSGKIVFLKNIKFLTEVTTAVSLTRNVYLISFLIGFSCLCVWLQIYTLAKPIKISPLKFIAARCFHGLFNIIFTYILLRVLRPNIATISNNISFSDKTLYSSPAISAALLLMGILFCITLFSKKIYGNLIKDMV